ncbi:Ethylene-responsive transcription factor ERF017 [Striga hermonthica]|uniref:Ethylene-responsive transcription factor ERF017 n=1 Tax=Striga hermonthica TaxID=68872 RepID=A0A9N7NS34_STRHE|nr:Ethylene-responsive transcription factor ERF017 [Striga hermonthica]
MVKQSSPDRREEEQPSSSGGCAAAKYKGVRKRKWGKYVSEIRLPNSRERIWLGSYDTAEKAARAFDAALFCLRGRAARFNFPDDPPEIAGGRSMAPAEIQTAAARFAHGLDTRADGISGRTLGPESRSESFGSPCPSISERADSEMTGMPPDVNILHQLLGTGNDGMYDFGMFSGFDDFSGDFLVPVGPEPAYWPEYNEELLYSEASSSSLWNF